MAIPFGFLFLGAQNWMERNTPEGYWGLGFAWVGLAIGATLLTTAVSPIAASISTVVSAIRRRSVPAEYRQHGRNWQPFKPFVGTAIAVASFGAALGMLTHFDQLPRWNNLPLSAIEQTFSLHRLEQYAQASAVVRQAGFFVSSQPAPVNTQGPYSVAFDIQNNLNRLGHKLKVTGEMDNATQQAVTAYAKRRKLNASDPQAVLASMCKDLRGACANFSQSK